MQKYKTTKAKIKNKEDWQIPKRIYNYNKETELILQAIWNNSIIKIKIDEFFYLKVSKNI